MTFDLYIPAVPVAQPRARATSIAGHAHVYNPSTIRKSDGSYKAHPVAAFKATVRHALHEKFKGAPLEGPLSISAVFVFTRPQRLLRKKDPIDRIRHVSKPDRDNCDKAILDAMKGLLFVDDCQVCGGSIEKWYAAKDEQAHVEIQIVEMLT